MENKYGLTNRIRISNAVDKKIWQNLKEYSDDTGIPISKLLDRSIQMFLNSIENNNNQFKKL